MLCASCNVPLDEPSDTCPICGYSALLLDRYRLLFILSSNGDSGTLFRAMDTEGERAVVVRELPLHVITEEADVEACEAAYASLQGVSIPGLAFWRDRKTVGRRRSRILFAVQDHIQGQPLNKSLSGPTPLPEALSILDELLAVLEVMHEHTPPLAHRDLKPENILRTDSGLMLVDAGGARDVVLGARCDGGGLPNAGSWLAPEQRHGEGGAPSDIYAAGLLLLTMLTGHTVQDCTGQTGELLSDTLETVHPDIAPLLARMLHSQPAARPSSVAHLRAQLHEILEQCRAEEQPTLEQPDYHTEPTEVPADSLPPPQPQTAADSPPTRQAPVPRSTAAPRVAAASAAAVTMTAGAAAVGGPVAAGVVGVLSSVGVLVFARSVRTAPAEIPWATLSDPNTVETSELFQEALLVLEGAYPAPPPALLRIRDYVSSRDYGALKMDIPRLRNQLHQHHRLQASEVPPAVKASLQRLHVLSQRASN